MRTIVITGGTDGMGRALARHHLDRGDALVVIGRSPQKGADWLAWAQSRGASDRAWFIQADLSGVADNLAAIEAVKALVGSVDALVLCARHFRSVRHLTTDGFENSFALEYLSRFVLSHGLVGLLQQAQRPVIVNVSGPGIPKPEIRWDDLALERDYDGVTAQLQAGRANDLLGLSFASAHRQGSIGYVLVNPGAVATSFSGEYDAADAAHVQALKRFGKPVRDGIAPISAIIDDPPAEALSAFMERSRIRIDDSAGEAAAAVRLDVMTKELLASLGQGVPPPA